MRYGFGCLFFICIIQTSEQQYSKPLPSANVQHVSNHYSKHEYRDQDKNSIHKHKSHHNGFNRLSNRTLSPLYLSRHTGENTSACSFSMGGVSYNQFPKSPPSSFGTVVHGIVKN